MSGEMLISVVVITHNRREMLIESIRSIVEQRSHGEYEIIVVDNASTDDTVEAVKRCFPAIKCISLSENAGVSEGRNVGASAAGGEIVVFIDDDAVFERCDALEIVAERFRKYPEVAVLAFRIVNDATNSIMSHEFPMRIFTADDTEKERYVSYFVGCGFAVRRSVFLMTGGFFSEMFYGPEEVEFSYRVLDAGYDILYCNEVVVRHKASPTVRRKGVYYYHAIRSRILMALRNLPIWAMVPYLTIWHIVVFKQSILSCDMTWFARGVVSGWKDSLIALRKRKVIGPETISKVRKLSGRLFC